MGTLHHHPLVIRYQGGPGDHVIQIRAGRTIRSGVGQSFWLRAGRSALAEVPIADRAHSFLVQTPSADQQNVNAQVSITYRIEDPEAAAKHYDFGLYPRGASADPQGLWQIDELVTRLASSSLASAIAAMPLSEAISGSLDEVGAALVLAFERDEQLRATGVGVVDARLMALRPDEGVESSLRAPLLERLQAEADRALYERRALAVARESRSPRTSCSRSSTWPANAPTWSTRRAATTGARPRRGPPPMRSPSKPRRGASRPWPRPTRTTGSASAAPRPPTKRPTSAPWPKPGPTWCAPSPSRRWPTTCPPSGR